MPAARSDGEIPSHGGGGGGCGALGGGGGGGSGGESRDGEGATTAEGGIGAAVAGAGVRAPVAVGWTPFVGGFGGRRDGRGAIGGPDWGGDTGGGLATGGGG